MGKITVKHYINKRILPEIIDNIEYYPIYVQVTIRRKSVQFKSNTSAKISENEFNKYQKGLDFSCSLADKFKKSEIDGTGLFNKEYLIKEPERIERAILHISKCFENSSSFLKEYDGYVKSWVDGVYMLWADNELIKLCWDYVKFNLVDGKEIETKWKKYDIFNRENNFIDSIKNLKKYFNVDITQCIDKQDIEIWKNMNLLLKHLEPGEIFIDLVNSDLTSRIMNINGIKDKPKFIKQIKEIITHDFVSKTD